MKSLCVITIALALNMCIWVEALANEVELQFQRYQLVNNVVLRSPHIACLYLDDALSAARTFDTEGVEAGFGSLVAILERVDSRGGHVCAFYEARRGQSPPRISAILEAPFAKALCVPTEAGNARQLFVVLHSEVEIKAAGGIVTRDLFLIAFLMGERNTWGDLVAKIIPEVAVKELKRIACD